MAVVAVVGPRVFLRDFHGQGCRVFVNSKYPHGYPATRLCGEPIQCDAEAAQRGPATDSELLKAIMRPYEGLPKRLCGDIRCNSAAVEFAWP